jgi:hypothetical protein
MARKQLAQQWAENRHRRDEEERRQRVMVITEFERAPAAARFDCPISRRQKSCRRIECNPV